MPSGKETQADPSKQGKNYIYLDFCFFEYCNFTCTYCRDSNEEMSKGKGVEAFDATIETFLKYYRAAILKLSGQGEATLWKELPTTVEKWADRFTTVQLISNGTGNPTLMERLSRLSNFQACITLDGHTPELNRLRTKRNSHLHERVVKTIDRLSHRGVPTELNCVITQANAAGLREYLDWVLNRWGSSVIVLPFPVRPFYDNDLEDIRSRLVASPSQIDALSEVLVTDHGRYEQILPSVSYTRKLIDFMRAEQRTTRCYIHRANFGVMPNHEVVACSCAGANLELGVKNALGTIQSIQIDPVATARRARYLEDGKVGPRCKWCFTHFDIINLFLDDTLTIEDVRKIPSLRDPSTTNILREMQNEFSHPARPDHTARLPAQPIQG